MCPKSLAGSCRRCSGPWLLRKVVYTAGSEDLVSADHTDNAAASRPAALCCRTATPSARVTGPPRRCTGRTNAAQAGAHPAASGRTGGRPDGPDRGQGPDRDPRMAGEPGIGARLRGSRTGALPAGRADERGAPPGCAGALFGQHALPQHHPARPRGAAPGRPGDRAQDPLATSAGTRWRSSCAPTRRARELGGHIASFQSSALLYDTGFMHFWHAPTRSHGGDLVYVQGHCLARDLRPQLPRGPADRGAAAEVPPGGRRRRPQLLPAPLADAGLLAVPDRLDGPRAR